MKFTTIRDLARYLASIAPDAAGELDPARIIAIAREHLTSPLWAVTDREINEMIIAMYESCGADARAARAWLRDLGEQA